MAALITNFLFITLLISVSYMKLWPKVKTFFGSQPAVEEGNSDRVVVSEATINRLT